MRVNAPWGAMILQEEKDSPARLLCGRDNFWKNIFCLLGGRGDTRKEKNTHLSHAHSNSFVWLMFRFGAGHTVVAGVGIADGSRAKYDAGI